MDITKLCDQIVDINSTAFYQFFKVTISLSICWSLIIWFEWKVCLFCPKQISVILFNNKLGVYQKWVEINGTKHWNKRKISFNSLVIFGQITRHPDYPLSKKIEIGQLDQTCTLKWLWSLILNKCSSFSFTGWLHLSSSVCNSGLVRHTISRDRSQGVHRIHLLALGFQL